jgi:hypothetical protein
MKILYPIIFQHYCQKAKLLRTIKIKQLAYCVYFIYIIYYKFQVPDNLYEIFAPPRSNPKTNQLSQGNRIKKQNLSIT